MATERSGPTLWILTSSHVNCRDNCRDFFFLPLGSACNSRPFLTALSTKREGQLHQRDRKTYEIREQGDTFLLYPRGVTDTAEQFSHVIVLWPRFSSSCPLLQRPARGWRIEGLGRRALLTKELQISFLPLYAALVSAAPQIAYSNGQVLLCEFWSFLALG